MTTIPDFGQAHETCGGVKPVKWGLSHPQTSGQRKTKKSKAATKEP